KLALMIDEVYDDWVAENISKPSHRIIARNIKTARKLSYSIMALYSVMNSSFLLKSVVSYLFGDVDDRIFIVPAVFPWNGRQSPIYEITIISQFIMSSSVLYSLAVIEGQLAFLVLHATSLVYIVKEEIAELSQHSQRNPVDKDHLRSTIKRISQKHSKFLTFAKNLEDSFSMVSFVHVTGLTLLIMTSGFTVMVATENNAPVEALNYAIFLLAFLLNSAFYCYAGEYLTNHSETIAMEINSCPWYEFPTAHQKDINFILMRAQIPVVMTAGKFNQLSLVLLSS
ncbi:hypothetical protein QAD02_015416, partial [Eretmocerus hayati]